MRRFVITWSASVRHPRGVLVAALAALAAAAPVAAQHAYVGTPAALFEAGGPRPLHMPTTVAVAPNGTVYVADGVNDRIVVWNDAGEFVGEIREAGGLALARPIGVKTDRAGNIWIADTGNSRVVALAPDGTLVRAIDVPKLDAERSTGVADVALSPDGGQLWISDNHNHRVLRLGLDEGAWTVHGRPGEALGQFQYPFMLAAAPNGDLVVSDVTNARVQWLARSGAPVGSSGAYGVHVGDLYRPKGVAVDEEGNLWVADSVMGVVQVFASGRGVIDVLRDSTGAPLHFSKPVGITLDAAGALYVTELGADRVSKIVIHKDAATAKPLPTTRNAAGADGRQGRACTVCHLDWLSDFADQQAIPLMPAPQSTRDDPYVSRSDVCLSCHDGSVVDSRRRVWRDHGHRTGVEPPEGMRVPPNLPLIDGRLACRTCHSAHGTGEPQGDIARAVFLRARNVASEMCISCHSDKTRGPRFGTHPTGGMPWPVPPALTEVGARVGPNPRELTCQVCHTPHGARNDHLLVLGTTSNQLCLTCHDQMRPGMFRAGRHTEHPLTAKLNAEQAAAVTEMGTKLGPDGQLICLTCHKLHHGKAERFLLAADLQDGEMCLKCHSERRELLGTQHDLRTNFPDEKNRLGMTPSSGGPCSACHMFHRYAREMTPGPLDPTGKCLTCHQPGQCAEKKALGDLNHPNAQCLDCHNPHAEKHRPFLVAPAANVCSQCHSSKAELMGGPHDFLTKPDGWPAVSIAAGDRCLACHRPHGSQETGLFRAGIAETTAGDGTCLACHKQVGWGQTTAQAVLHPRQIARPGAEGLPLFPGNDEHDPQQLGCRTCHDPHRRGPGDALLRTVSGSDDQLLCLRCHSDQRFIELTRHSMATLAKDGLVSDSCRPCHTVHASPALSEPRFLFAQSLMGPQTDAPESAAVDDRHCTACHRTGGVAPPPAIASHPPFPMTNRPAQEQGHRLPLYTADTEDEVMGRITCRTCHTPHGRAPDAALAASDAELRRFEERGVPPAQLRPFAPPNLCSGCHGFDALRRFLYFHDPQRRAGPLE